MDQRPHNGKNRSSTPKPIWKHHLERCYETNWLITGELLLAFHERKAASVLDAKDDIPIAEQAASPAKLRILIEKSNSFVLLGSAF